MDADTRHQLKQNELAEALGKMVDLNDKRTVVWIAVILAAALCYAGYKYVDWRSRVQQIQNAQALTQINVRDAAMGEAPLTSLRELIAKAKDPGLIALARLQLAEGLETRGLEPDGASKLIEAEQEYQKVVNMSGAPAAVKAPALYRLGILGETKRDFAAAREMYTLLSSDARYAGSPYVGQAMQRLEMLDELAQPVAFTPGNKPLEELPPTADVEMRSILTPESNDAEPAFQAPVALKPPDIAPVEETPAESPEEAPAETSEETSSESPAQEPDETEPEQP